MPETIKTIIASNLCIGCGFCAVSCPADSISMQWTTDCTWTPNINNQRCNNCGVCYSVCPHSPDTISAYAGKTAKAGTQFGLEKHHSFFISYDNNVDNRIRSTSGGTLTVLLQHMLTNKIVDGIITSVPIYSKPESPTTKLKSFVQRQSLIQHAVHTTIPLAMIRLLRKSQKILGVMLCSDCLASYRQALNCLWK